MTRMTEQMREERRGLECPKCGCGHFHVVYTRRGTGGRIIRRRECRHCGRRITTAELEVGRPLGEARAQSRRTGNPQGLAAQPAIHTESGV